MDTGKWKRPQRAVPAGVVVVALIAAGVYAMNGALAADDRPLSEAGATQSVRDETSRPRAPRNSTGVSGGERASERPERLSPPRSPAPSASRPPKPAAKCDPPPRPTPPRDSDSDKPAPGFPVGYNGDQIVSGCITPTAGGGSNARVLSYNDAAKVYQAIRDLERAKPNQPCTKEFRGHFQLVIQESRRKHVFNGEGHGCGWVTYGGVTYTGGRAIFNILGRG